MADTTADVTFVYGLEWQWFSLSGHGISILFQHFPEEPTATKNASSWQWRNEKCN